MSRERETEIIQLGRRIRRRRRGLGLTLKEVEVRAGLSLTHVSEVERGIAAPSLRCLGKIAGALDVGLAELLGERDVRPAVIVGVARHRRAFSIGQGAAMFESLLDPKSPFDFSLHIVSLSPNASLSERECKLGVAEEFASVLQGCLVMRIDAREVVLDEGDAVHFRGDALQSLHNPGAQGARALWATYPRARW